MSMQALKLSRGCFHCYDYQRTIDCTLVLLHDHTADIGIMFSFLETKDENRGLARKFAFTDGGAVLGITYRVPG